jgi:hypothetical protein
MSNNPTISSIAESANSTSPSPIGPNIIQQMASSATDALNSATNTVSSAVSAVKKNVDQTTENVRNTIDQSADSFQNQLSSIASIPTDSSAPDSFAPVAPDSNAPNSTDTFAPNSTDTFAPNSTDTFAPNSTDTFNYNANFNPNPDLIDNEQMNYQSPNYNNEESSDIQSIAPDSLEVNPNPIPSSINLRKRQLSARKVKKVHKSRKRCNRHKATPQHPLCKTKLPEYSAKKTVRFNRKNNIIQERFNEYKKTMKNKMNNANKIIKQNNKIIGLISKLKQQSLI